MIRGNVGTGTRFSGSAGQTARLMLYGLIAIVLMAMDHRGQYVPKVRNVVENAVEPVYHVVEWPFRAAGNLSEQFRTRRELRHENEELRRRLLAQQADLQRLATLREENRRLRALFEGADSLEFEYRFAELLRVELDPFSHLVLIDRGSDDGVTVGQAVIDGAGVMGQVEDVHLHFASVRLISDPNHALPVQINRTGLRTVAFGLGETDRLVLPNVPREADVRVGDLVVTSGLGDRFPGGYPVAEVRTIDREPGRTFARVEAAPLAALDRGREVLLIRSNVRPPVPPAPEASEAPDGAAASAAGPTGDDAEAGEGESARPDESAEAPQ
ncbi:MAG: rod shape-determining protein MreC [Xanthomonadales bacterium]